MKRTISAEVGKGSVNHNSRKFKAANVNPERTHLNVEYCNEPIKQVYHKLFDEALEIFIQRRLGLFSDLRSRSRIVSVADLND